MKKIWNWIKVNTKIVLSILFSVAIVIVSLLLYKRKKDMDSMRRQLAFYKTKVEMQKLAYEYQKSIDDLADLRKDEKDLNEKLKTIEGDLSHKLKDNMSADEIVAKFKELGLRD